MFGHAVIEPRGVADSSAVAEGVFAPVVAQRERLRVVVQQGVVVGEEAAGCGGGALEARGAGGCLDGAPGGRAGEAAAWRSAMRSSTVSATARTVSMSISSWMPSRLRAAYPS